MQIKPSQIDFENWIAIVPTDEDLVFLTREKIDLFRNLPFEPLTREQVKSQGLKVWTLNKRSWYGYALDSADYCVVLPKGAIESFDKDLKNELADEQRKLYVPTVTQERWMTTHVWSQLDRSEKINTLQAWLVKNEVRTYDSIELQNLPHDAGSELSRIRYDGLLNGFSAFSGPNCFAAVAGAIENNKNTYLQWLHWPELERLLLFRGFGITQDDPKTGDVLIFHKDETQIHASYFLGNGLYFEKPGQDFYEPYRIANFTSWQASWPEAKISICRKGG